MCRVERRRPSMPSLMMEGVNVQLDDSKSSPTDNKSSSQGRAILLLVAFLYGTLNVKLVTSASESNVILCLESVFAACCAYAFLGEVSSIREIAGGAMIVFAAILASR